MYITSTFRLNNKIAIVECYLVQLFGVPDTTHTYNTANNANAEAIFFLSIVHLYETNKTTFSFDMFIADDIVYRINIYIYVCMYVCVCVCECVYVCVRAYNKMKCTLNHVRGGFISYATIYIIL